MASNTTGNQTIAIAFAAFIALGLTSGLLGLAWPSMRQEFNWHWLGNPAQPVWHAWEKCGLGNDGYSFRADGYVGLDIP